MNKPSKLRLVAALLPAIVLSTLTGNAQTATAKPETTAKPADSRSTVEANSHPAPARIQTRAAEAN